MDEDWTSYDGEAWQANSSSYDGVESWHVNSSSYDGWESWYNDDYPDYSYYGSDYAESWDEPGTYESLFDELSYEGADENELASTIQEAYLANHNYDDTTDADAYYGKGKGKKGKGKGKFHHKGKGKGKFSKGKPYGGGNLSLEDRRQRLAEFKKRTKCQSCGQKGHWAGDKECPRNKAHVTTANMAIRKPSASSDDGFMLPHENGSGVCLMHDAPGFDLVGEDHEDDWLNEPEDARDQVFDLIQENLEMVPGHDSKLASAQYKGRTYSEVTCLDQEFAKWVMMTKHRVPDLVRYQTWLNTCLVIDGKDELRVKQMDQMVPPEAQQKARPDRPQCADGCKFGRRGTNAYASVKTCTVCGYQEKSKKPLPEKQFEYDNCPHDIWDWRGSSKKTARKFCIQCHTFIAEMPQQAARERKKAGQELAASSEEVLRTSSTMMRQELIELSKGEALACLRECAKQLQRAPEDKSIKASDLIKMLQENIDVVSQPLPLPVAHMAIGRRWADSDEWYYDPWFDEYSNWQPERQMPIHGVNRNLREVDILEDDGVWAILDEGCNTTCHSKEWRVNAEKKLLAKGFTMEYCHSEKSYNGVGGTATKASMMFRIPFAIEVGPEYKSLAGVIESFELETPPGHFVPMLISLSNQATLGLVKDMRTGTAVLKDYQVEIEICRARQNGLFCINIGALETAMRCRHGKLPRHLRPLRVGTDDFAETFCSGGSRKCLYIDAVNDLEHIDDADEIKDRSGCMMGVGMSCNRQDPGLDAEQSSDSDTVEHELDSQLDAAAICTQEGGQVPPVTMVGTVSIGGKSPKFSHGGGWRDGPAATADTGRIYIVGTGYKFEETKRGNQRGGKGTFLPENAMWLTNFLNKLKGKRPTLGKEGADDLETCIRMTFEWHLNASNSKAAFPLWRCKDEQMYYEFVDMTHLRAPKGKDGKRHPGGGIKGAKHILEDKIVEDQLEELGNSIFTWSSDENSKDTNLVILVMDADDGLATLHLCQAIKEALKKNWYDYGPNDISVHLMEDIDEDCHRGKCTTCYKEGATDLAHKLVDKVLKQFNFGDYVNRKFHPELVKKREKARRARIAEKRTEKRTKEKEAEKRESKRGRSRSRGRRAFTTKQLMPLGAVDSLTTEERHTLCLSLKQAGLLEEGINAMYKPGVQPNRNLHEVVLKLELNPETILGMAGRKDIPKVLKQIEDYIESLDADDPDYPFGHLFSDDDDKPKTKEKAPAETSWDTAKEEIKGDPREKSEVREKDKKKKRKSKKEKKEDKRSKGESGAEASEEPGRKKLKKEEEPVETGGLVTVSMEEEADYEDDHRENDDDEEADEKPVKKEESSDSESVEDPGGLEIKNENEESQDEKRSPLKLTERKTPASPERPPSWLTGDGKGKQKSKYSKGKGKHKSKRKFKQYQSDCMSKDKMVEMLMEWANKNQASWDEAKRNYLTWYEFKDFALRVHVKKKPRNSRMTSPVECWGWKKFALLLQDVDGSWECTEISEDKDYEEEFGENSPHLLVTVLAPPWILEDEMTLEASRGKGYSYFTTGIMNSTEKNNFSKSIDEVSNRDAMIKARFTNSDSHANRAYMGLTAEDGHGPGKKGSKVSGGHITIALLVLLGFTCPLTPTGHRVIEVTSEKEYHDTINHLDKNYYEHVVVVKSLDYDQSKMTDVVETVEGKKCMSTYITAQFGEDNNILQCYDLPRWNGPGDISFYSSGEIGPLKNWAGRKDKYRTPRTVNDVSQCTDFQVALEEMFHSTVTFCHAFPAEAEEERIEELGTLDAPEFDDGEDDPSKAMREMRGQAEAEELFDKEEQMLEEIPLPNLPTSERERREEWMKLPRATRIAVRKMHRQFGHATPRVLLEILRASGAKPEFLKAARILRCEGCDAHKPKAQTSKVALPRTYEFNRAVGVDIFEVKDANNVRYSILSIVDQGTCFHQACVVREGGSQPSSQECFRAFQEKWSAWAGQPHEVVTDRGLHNRGDFAQGLASRGTVITTIGVESPEMIGRTERHGGLLKAMVVRTIAELKLTGREAVAEAINQCVITKNSMSRVKGFAPVQWVLGRLPREPGTVFEEDSWADLGSLQMASDGTTEFGRISRIREKARKAFIRADMSSRVSRAILRKSAPIQKEYRAGDMVCYRTDQSGWSTTCRIIGFDGDKLAWVLHRGTPACVAIDRIRPVNASEALAHQFLQNQKPFVFGGSGHQQGYLDMREELPPVHEGEEEDESDGYTPTEVGDTPLVEEAEEVPMREGTEETLESAMTEPDVELIPSSRRRSSEHLDDVPIQIRRRLSESQAQLPTESRATESRASTSPLVQTWQGSGTSGPGVEMANRGFEGAHIAENQDEWHLDEKLGMLIRVHNSPRIALFSIEDIKDCPVTKDQVTKGRITEVVYLNGTENVIQDTWNDDFGTKMLGQEWTGKTVFFLKHSQTVEKGKRKKNGELEEFTKERFHAFNTDGQLSKNAKKKARGKVFDYDHEDQETQHGLDTSRMAEWNKWMKFMAVQIVSGSELTKLLQEGHKPIPTQWIDTDKNEHLKRPGCKHSPLFKSRLVARGDLEQSYSDIRTDSPTAEVEALNILLAWCVSSLLWICSIDITNAYFHGMVLDRLMLLRPPKGGLPDKNIPEGSMMLARVPIYGTRDAGRRFWAKLKKVLTDIGLHQNSQCKALFTYQEDGDIKVMIACHVDDLLYATKPGYESYIEKILEAFHVEKEKISEKNFRFCGREIAQDDQKNIKVTCTATAEKIEPVKFRTGLKKTDAANDAENAQLRSVVGSLSWVARQARPDLSYRVSRLQSACGRATIRDLHYCNEVVKDAQEFSKHGLYFEAGAIRWNDCILCTVSDASWSNESQVVKGKLEPYRSQRARMTLLVDKAFINGDETKFYPIGWSSTTIKRVCRSTMQAESYAMTSSVEEGFKIRATIADCCNQLDLRNWEESSRKFMKHLWLTDCKSLQEHLCAATLTKTSDKRLSVDLAALRQLIWEKDGEESEEITDEHPDQIQWIDTSIMLVDSLTKDMNTNYLRSVMKEGSWSTKATAESEVTKMAKQKWRKLKREQKENEKQKDAETMIREQEEDELRAGN